MKFFLAIIDQDEIYLDRLIKYFCDNYNDRVELYAFSTILSFFAFLKDTKVDMVLINEKLKSNEVYELDIPIITLTEKPISVRRKKEIISKYVSCEDLYKNILKFASENFIISERKNTKNKSYLYMATSNYHEDFVSALAFLKNHKGQNLLIDLSSFSISSKYIDIANSSISDFIINLRNLEVDHAIKLESYTSEFQGVDVLLGFDNPCDSESLQYDDIKNLIKTIQVCKYDNIVVFMSDYIGEKYISIFEEVDEIMYSVFDENVHKFIAERVAKILRTYENKASVDIMHKLKDYDLSTYIMNFQDSNFIAQLSKESVWSV